MPLMSMASFAFVTAIKLTFGAAAIDASQNYGPCSILGYIETPNPQTLNLNFWKHSYSEDYSDHSSAMPWKSRFRV